MGMSTGTLGCHSGSPSHPLVGSEDHNIPQPGTHSHSFGPCEMVKRADFSYWSRAGHQASSRQLTVSVLLIIPCPSFLPSSQHPLPAAASSQINSSLFIFPWLPVFLHLYPNKVLLVRLPRNWWPCRTMGRKVPALLSLAIWDSWLFLMYILPSHL